jgi:hypothetical protein
VPKKKTKDEELTPRQVKALCVLIAGQTQERAAAAANVTQKTMIGWLKDDHFRNELRLSMERLRQQFESRVMSVANNSLVVVQELLSDPDKEMRAKGASLALNAAVRLSTRYKELQIEGVTKPPPLVVFPASTKLPWAQKALAAPEHTVIKEEEEVIDVEAQEIDGDGDTSSD